MPFGDHNEALLCHFGCLCDFPRCCYLMIDQSTTWYQINLFFDGMIWDVIDCKNNFHYGSRLDQWLDEWTPSAGILRNCESEDNEAIKQPIKQVDDFTGRNQV